MACHSSPVKKKNRVTNSSMGSARLCNRSVLRRSCQALRTDRASSGSTP
jgi:hypothetical protein